MRLKSLRLAGFKSFANPTTFSFGKNITAIVGPNGCGKSNVIDAIRWVLGESSAKQLRGGAMSDVIFAGSQNTAAKSLASVELTFEHTQDEQTGIRHELNLYHELAVRRQVNKDGKSDYFINGTRCRRRDVVDIFLGTGLGARSYAVIEQGMIGRIVDSNPMQLRQFIEEGAGVSRYQARRLETHKKLAQAQENLDRLNDLKSELEKQQKTLAKQAETAKRHQELTEKLHKIEQDISIYQLYSAKYSEQQQQKAYNKLNEAVAAEQTTLSQQTSIVDKLATRIAEQQWLKDDARDKHHNQQLNLQTAEHKLGQHNNRIEQLVEKQNSLVNQEKDNQVQLSALVEKQKLEQQQLDTISPQLTELNTRKAEIQARLEPLISQWQQIHSQRDELQNQQRQLEKQHALAEQASVRLQQEQQKWLTRQNNWQQAWQTLTAVADLDSLNQQLGENKNRLASSLRQHEDATANLEEEQQAFTQFKEQAQQAQNALQTLEKQHATLNSEYNTLHALVYPPKTKQASANNASEKSAHLDQLNPDKLNTSKLNLDQLTLDKLNLNKLSDKIELTKQGQAYASILDKWLAMWLDGLLVDSLRVDDSLANALAVDGAKPDDWLALLAQTPANNPAENAANTLLASSNLSTKTNGAEKSSCTEQLVAELIPLNTLISSPKLNMIDSVYLLLVEALTEPLTEKLTGLIHSLPNGSIIITDTGWLAGQFGIIHLSKFSKDSGDSHFLRQREQQRSRLAELEDELNDIEDKLDDQQKLLKKAQTNHDDKQIVIEELTAQVNNLQNQAHEHRQAITQLNANLERQQADNDRLTKEQQQLAQDKTALDSEQQQADASLASVNEQLPALNQTLATVENERGQIRFERSEADNQSREVDGALQSVTMQQQQLTLSINHLTEQVSRIRQQQSRHCDEQNKLQNDIDRLEEQLPTLDKTFKEQQSLCHESKIKLDEYDAQLAELQNEHNGKREQHQQAQIKLAKQQQQLAEMTTKLAIAKERLNEACNRVDSLANLHSQAHTQDQYQKQPNKQTEAKQQSTARTILNKLIYVPARYLILSQHYYQPYQTSLQALIATGQSKLRFANAAELIAQLKIGESSAADEANLSTNSVSKEAMIAQANDKPSLAVSSASLLTDFILHRGGKFDETLEASKQQQRQQEYQSIQVQIGRIGAVNLVAVAELAQVNERLEPLTEQIDDILASINKLTQAISTIDNKTKELFLQALEDVNKDLLHLFSKVFGGGQASLSLIDDESLDKKDKWRAGLELMAQPKGKKNSRLAVLSGGEKTLTALSLIFAIFKQHPAPFCVLDEVDAPLDDANVGRFTGLIEELASDLQFIFISHNKLSMQIADELKGITMPNAGISTLVSVSLDEAEQYIEA